VDKLLHHPSKINLSSRPWEEGSERLRAIWSAALSLLVLPLNFAWRWIIVSQLIATNNGAACGFLSMFGTRLCIPEFRWSSGLASSFVG
jgi:hypothetical protein